MRFFLFVALMTAAPVAAQSVVVVVGSDSVAVDLAAIQPVRMAAVRIHDGPERTVAGPALADVLRAGGVRVDSLRGAALARVVVVEASDGYRVVLALAELAPDLGRSPAFLATRADSAPLGAPEGPVRLVVPGDDRPVRWAHSVVRLRVLTVGG